MYVIMWHVCTTTVTEMQKYIHFFVVGIDVAVNNTEEHAIFILSALCYSVRHLWSLCVYIFFHIIS